MAALVGGELCHEASALVGAVDRAGERVPPLPAVTDASALVLSSVTKPPSGQPPCTRRSWRRSCCARRRCPTCSRIARCRCRSVRSMRDRPLLPAAMAQCRGTRRVGEHDDVARLHGSRRERGVDDHPPTSRGTSWRGAERRDGVRLRSWRGFRRASSAPSGRWR